MPNVLPDKIILFDSLCYLCNGWSRFIIHRDRRGIFTLCRVQSSAGQHLLRSLGLPLDTFETVIYLEQTGDGYRDYHKSEAAVHIATQLPAPWHLLSLIRFVPRPVRDLVYDAIARNRYRLFGRRDSCRLPSTQEQDRFLEEIDVD